MNVQYHGDTDSVRYLTTSPDTSSSLRSYGLSSRISSLWFQARTLLRDRMLLGLALTLSFSAFLLSLATYLDRSQALQTVAISNQEPFVGEYFPTFNYSSSIPFLENGSYSGSGSGMETEISNETFINIVSNLAWDVSGNAILKWEESLISNITDQLQGLMEINENRSSRVVEQIEALQHSHRLTKSQLQDLDTIINQIHTSHVNNSESISSLINSNENSFKGLLELLITTRTRLQDVEAKTYFQGSTIKDLDNDMKRRINSLQSSIDVLHGTSNRTTFAMISIQESLDKLRSEMNSEETNTQEEKFEKEIADLTSKINECVAKTQGNAHANVIMKSQLQTLKTSISSRSYSPIQLTQLESRLNTAIQAVQSRSLSNQAKLNGFSKAISDLEEFESVTNATLAIVMSKLMRKANRGWIQAPNGYEYHVTQSQYAKWEDAKARCVFLGGKLAHVGVRDKNMQGFIFTNLVEPRGLDAWIGLTDVGVESSWKWLDGQYLRRSEEFWATGQPNNFPRQSVDQDCAELAAKDGQWNDLWCDSQVEQNVALCERKAT